MSNKGAALAPSKAAGVNSRSTYGRSNATNTAAGGANKSHGSNGANAGTPPVFFQGRLATPVSLIQHRHITYVSSTKKQPSIDAIEEDGDDGRMAREGGGNASGKAMPSRRLRTSSSLSSDSNSFSQTNSSNNNSKRFNSSGTFGGNNAAVAVEVAEEVEVVQLSETHTEIVFSLNSFIAASDTRAVVQVEERNARYLALVEAHKNPDGFTESSSQTINLPLKNKDEMTSTNTTHEMACQAFSFEILDATSSVSAGANEYNDGAATVEEDPAGLSPYIRQFVSETLSVSVATVGCLLDTSTLTRSSSHHSGDTNNSSKAKKVESVGSGSTNLGSNSRRNNNLGGMSIKNPGIAGNPSSLRPTLSRKSGLHGSNSEDPSKDHNYDKEIIVVQKPKFEVLLEKDTERILASKQLLRSLQVAERAVQQNAYHHKHLDYRDLPDGLTSPLLSSSLVDRRSESQQNTASSALLGFGLSAATENSLGNKKTKSQLSGQQAAQSKAGGVSKTAAGSASGLGSVRSAEEKAEEDEAAGETSGSSDASRATGKVHLLYSYRNNDLVRGRPVTSMCWNCVNLDLLTVGYGTCDTVVDPSRLGTAVDEELQGGLVLFWSLRNPDYPEKILRTPHAVTCLDFSKQTPSVLAVGLISGDVLVFDMRRQREGDWGIPVESSMGMSGTHSDPIWQLSWVLKGSDRLETLVSISTDGNILEWNLKKGLVVSTLMQLKRNGVGEGWITRKAAGLCFDFLPSDPSSYLAGTEDGSVHHCSIAYNEQYLSTFERSSGGGAAVHDGPVHRVSFSPHWPELFLTCSADWTLSLFHTKQKTGLLSMHATGEDHGVNDICWCPGNSTLFASVTATAKLQIWDLSVSCIDPVINVDTNTFDDGSERDDQATQVPRISSTESRPNTSAFGAEEKEGKEKGAGKESTPVSKLIRNLATIAPARGLTCVRFGEKSPIVVVGDNKGVVSVFRLMHPIAITHEGPLQQSEKLKKSIISQTDPEKAARLLDIINKQTNTLSSSISAISPTPASPAVDEEAIVPPPLPPVPAVVEFKSQ